MVGFMVMLHKKHAQSQVSDSGVATSLVVHSLAHSLD
jgi:hypothetical protein